MCKKNSKNMKKVAFSHSLTCFLWLFSIFFHFFKQFDKSQERRLRPLRRRGQSEAFCSFKNRAALFRKRRWGVSEMTLRCLNLNSASSHFKHCVFVTKTPQRCKRLVFIQKRNGGELGGVAFFTESPWFVGTLIFHPILDFFARITQSFKIFS